MNCVLKWIQPAINGLNKIILLNSPLYIGNIISPFSGKGRLYPAYSLSGSEGDESPRRAQNNHTYQHPVYQQPAGLSDTPTSEENGSDATLTDSELALARDSTLLVHNGKFADKMPCNYQEKRLNSKDKDTFSPVEILNLDTFVSSLGREMKSSHLQSKIVSLQW
ncbi:hypothetical protein WA026_013948 [Henosepilachna vigintioctopunctata]|uniref:Uncharacterized protein n=1 Tax=Henosepilachna vigintioctopunctata TaxID=420089 RepID=A0AAW1UB96_9CUCU